MDKLKTRVLFISLIILALVSISAVAAADSVNDDIISANQEDFDLSEETNDVEQLGANAIDDTGSNDPLTAGEPGNFTDLQDLIDAAHEGDTIELEDNYLKVSGENPIIINKTITIDGKGYTIDANHLNAILTANATVTLKNIVFINGNATSQGTINLIKGSEGSVIDNCTFKDNTAQYGGAIYWISDNGVLNNSVFEKNNAENFTSNTGSNGGAIHWKGDNGIIENSNFTENSVRYQSAGGAIYFDGANYMTIIASNFNRNTVPGYGNTRVGGGAIYFRNSSNGRIERSNFTENDVNGSGGAILFDIDSKNQSIIESTFYKNNADGLDSNMHSPVMGYGGGAIYWLGTDGKVENCNFTENHASSVGGAIYYTESANIQLINNSDFFKNSADLDRDWGRPSSPSGGGAIFWLASDGKVDNSNFTDNYAKSSGGAIYYHGGNQSVSNSYFSGNTANSTNFGGGAIYFDSANGSSIDNVNFTENSAKKFGGAIFINASNNATIENVNFIENSAGDSGGAIRFGSSNHGSIENANFTLNSAGAGGAISYSNSKDSSIENANFIENAVRNSGGAISYSSSNNATINNANFTENTANGTQTSGAGAIYFGSSNNGTIKNSIFNENSAINGSGGAIIYSSSNNQKITDSSFSNNSANSSKNNAGGGAIYYSSSKNGTIENVNFTENSATAGGGAICYYGTGNTNQTIKDSNFLNNSVNGSSYSHGGAIYWGSPNGTIENVNFTENFASKNGGAIYYYGSSNKYQSITDSSFTKNTANGSSSSYGGGAIFYDKGVSNSSIENSNFTENSALSGVGGAIYYNSAHNDSIIDVNFTGNTAKSAGGAIYYKSANNQTIRDSSFTNNSVNATQTTTSYGGGAIYYSTAHNGSIENVNFTENHASNGGAIVYSGSHNQSIDVANFLNNNATNGGAIAYYTTSNNGSIENANFTGNVAKTNGGAIYYSSSDNQTIADSIFNGNNATSGSAIYHSVGSLNISSTELLENQAHAASLNGSAEVEGFDATIHTVFKGKDNLLNAIYTNAYTDVRLTDVDYWGAEDKMNTGSSEVTPVASADVSEEGTLVYIDSREAGINITVSIYDADGNFIKNITGKTDIYGDINISNLGLTPGKYKAKAIHEEDNYYTEIVSKEFEFEILKANSTVNGTDESEVYNDSIVVTVASENATAVIYNITNSEGKVVVSDTSIAANGTFTVPVVLDVGEYTVNYKTVVDDENYYNVATNSSKITVTPAPSSVSAEDVEKVYGEEITIPVASQNATSVTYNITGNGKEITGTVSPDGTITVPKLDVGEYTFTLTTVVDGNHKTSTNSSKITITPAPSSISAEDVEATYSDDVVLVATGENTTGINESTIVVQDAESNPVEATVTLSDDFTITISGLNAGEYKVSYTNKVDKNHNTASNVTSVVVLRIDTSVSNESASDKPGKNVTVEFTVNDQKGNPVANGTLTVTVEGKEYTVDVVDGKATFKDITLPDTPGNYSYDVSYSGEDNYNPSVGQLNLTVQKVDVFVTLPEVINYTGAVVDIVVDVIDEYGNSVNEGTVNLVIDFGTKLSNKLMATALSNTAEVSDGKAVFKDIALGEPGKYPSYAQYSGSDYYNEAENTSDVIVLPLNTTTESQDVSGHSGDKKDITADIVDQNGNPVKNGTAVLKVNGKEYTAEVKDGKAIFKDVELPSESTDATIDYLGNEYYNPSSTTIKITISEDEEPEGGDEPINGTEDKTSTANAVKAVSVLPSTGNPIALVILALLTLVSTVSLGNKK